jgi:hypothetical protein
LPPSVAAIARERLATVASWAHGTSTLRQVQAARSEIFEALPDFQQRTLTAIRAADAGSAEAPSVLDEHADRVVQRYVSLSVQHAVTALLLCCDAVVDPLKLLEVPGEVSAGMAYRNVGLGPAKDSALRHHALHTASWETRQIVGSAAHGEAALTLQLFHEYMGVHWKNHVDAQRLYLEQFLQWAVV